MHVVCVCAVSAWQAICTFRLAEGILSGIWCGISENTASGEVTEWENCPIMFKFSDDSEVTASLPTEASTCAAFVWGPHRAAPVGQVGGLVVGEGTSIWRDEKINFRLSGAFDWPQRTMAVTKQHTGKYTNEIELRGTFVPPEARCGRTPRTDARSAVRGVRRGDVRHELWIHPQFTAVLFVRGLGTDRTMMRRQTTTGSVSFPCRASAVQGCPQQLFIPATSVPCHVRTHCT